jgi:hypothetical protein
VKKLSKKYPKEKNQGKGENSPPHNSIRARCNVDVQITDRQVVDQITDFQVVDQITDFQVVGEMTKNVYSNCLFSGSPRFMGCF